MLFNSLLPLALFPNWLYIEKNEEISRRKIVMIYVCDACGWEYDEEAGDAELGIDPGTKFEELPDDFECPLCGVGKDEFSVKE